MAEKEEFAAEGISALVQKVKEPQAVKFLIIFAISLEKLKRISRQKPLSG